MKRLAPIILFTYDRLEHTKKTLEALQKNMLAEKSELFVYSDGGKDAESWKNVYRVRHYLRLIQGFKKITFIEQEKNIGLANSIIKGVTEVVNLFGKVIVLEDDLVTSGTFLIYMNKALDFYVDQKNIWHISGWNYPNILINDMADDTFAWRMMNCWGWATWADRWAYYKKDSKQLLQNFSAYDKYRFDLDGVGGFWSQVLKNEAQIMNTWAIFWYAIIFQNDGFCINPIHSFVENIGFDGTGTNTGFRNGYTQNLNTKEEIHFTETLKENNEILTLIKMFLLENKNELSYFSNNLEIILNQLGTTKEDIEEKYILYGAGSLTKLILPHIEKNVLFIVDQDIRLHRKLIQKTRIEPIDSLYKHTDIKIIITVLGREEEIKNSLLTRYDYDISKIITFSLLK